MPELVDLTEDSPSSNNPSTSNEIILTDPNAPLTAPINQPITTKPAKGKLYPLFLSSGLAPRLASGEVTQLYVANELSTSQRTISSYLAYYIANLRNEQSTSSWRLNSHKAKLLKVEHFALFRATYFRTHTGKPYITKPFHLRWIKGILDAIENGTKLTILSPPRHGKTELLIHFVIWLLIRNPNLRILWIGGNGDIAEDAVGLVKDELEGNEKLCSDFLPPGSSFKPTSNSSAVWNQGKIKLATRTISMKSASLRAMGRGKRILSLDADIIITDDIVDADSVASPTQRETDETWWDQNLTTRKEDHTAWVNIGSRQHPDDIHNKTLEDDTWDKIVEEAYDTDRLIDLDVHSTPQQVPADHARKGAECLTCLKWDQAGATLFPELRPMHYLMTTMKSIGRRRFSMIYLNNVESTGVVIFSKKNINLALNKSRSIMRLDQIPELSPNPSIPGWKVGYTHKVGGLDPAGFSGYQASFIWAFNIPCQKQYMIDSEAERGGGIAEARDTIIKYHKDERIQLKHWVIEENLYQGGIIKDEKLQEYCSVNGIVLEGHLTYTNKWDPEMGVTGLAPLFESGVIDLPYADEESIAKTDAYRKQLIKFEGKLTKQQKKKTAASDLVMASWFPQTVYRRLLLEFESEQQEVETDYHQTPYPDDMIGDMMQLDIEAEFQRISAMYDVMGN